MTGRSIESIINALKTLAPRIASFYNFAMKRENALITPKCVLNINIKTTYRRLYDL